MPRNILILMADELRFDLPGFMGNPIARTPTMDRLAREIVERVVHPTHIPFVVKAKPAFVGMAGHVGPGGRLLCELLEGDGFELPVPRAMHARLKAKIAGCGCMPSSIIWGCRFRAR